MGQVVSLGMNLTATDVTGQRRVPVGNVAPDATVGELVNTLVGRMRLVSKDPEGREYTFRARLEREGRHLHASERVGDALMEGDEISLQPNIDAGGGC